MSLLSRSLMLALAAWLAVPAAAWADEKIVAQPPNRYATPSVTIDQGERLTFQNADVVSHDVTAEDVGPGNKPLFSSPLVAGGSEAFVEGSQYLTTGSYKFLCSVHPSMRGTLTVTSAGTPVPRPGSGGSGGGGSGGGGGGGGQADTKAPAISVEVKASRASGVRRARALKVAVTVDEAADVQLTATVGSKGKVVAAGSVGLGAAGTRMASLRLTRAGRRALSHAATVTVAAKAVDKAGNTAQAAPVSKTLR
jgi:plastocyanin